MKNLWAVVVLVLAACGSKDGGSEVLAKLADFEKQLCACTDEACAKKVAAEHETYTKGGAMKKPSDEQMKTVMATERRIDACEAKFVLSESGTKELEALKTGMAGAKEKLAAGKYSEAMFGCSDSSLKSFERDHGAIASTKPEIKAVLDEYRTYCGEGIHLEAATTAVTKAETARAATPKGYISECMSPDMTLAEMKLKTTGADKLAPLKDRFSKACPR